MHYNNIEMIIIDIKKLFCRLSQKYCDEVLNPMSMILFRKTADTSKSSKHTIIDDTLDDLADKFHFEDVIKNMCITKI